MNALWPFFERARSVLRAYQSYRDGLARGVQKLIGMAEVNRGWFGDDMIGHGQAPSDLAAADNSDGRSAGPRD
jgi:hypothetical protein